MNHIFLGISIFLISHYVNASCSKGNEYYCDELTDKICFLGDMTKDRSICIKYNDAQFGTAEKRKAAAAKLNKGSVDGIGLDDAQKAYLTAFSKSKELQKESEKLRDELEDAKKDLKREAKKYGYEVKGTGIVISKTKDLNIGEMEALVAKAKAIDSNYSKKVADINSRQKDLQARSSAIETEIKRQDQLVLDKFLDDRIAGKRDEQLEKAKKMILKGELKEVLSSVDYNLVKMDDILDFVEESQDNAEMGIYIQSKLARLETNFCSAVLSCKNPEDKADLKLDEIFSRETPRSGSSKRLNSLKKGTK